MKNRRKIDQNSTKYQLKMDQISTKNRPKSSILATKTGVPHWPGSWDDFSGVLGASWAVLEASWRGLGAVLEASWPLLGAPWGRLGPSCNVVERSRRRLGTSQTPLKLFLGRFYLQKTVFLSHVILDVIFH